MNDVNYEKKCIEVLYVIKYILHFTNTYFECGCALLKSYEDV